MQATPESDRAEEGPSTSATLTRAERLRLAVEICRRTDAPTAPVARQYGLAPTTLYRHVRGGVRSPGGQPSFSAAQEEIFVRHLEALSDWLIPISVDMLLEYVESFLEANQITVKRFKDNKPGKDWGYGFLKRHSTRLARRRTVNITPRKGLVEADVVRRFFDRLKLQLSGDGAFPPSCILNYDETNLTNDPGNPWLIVRRRQHNQRRVINHSKAGFSVMFAVVADGTLLPPYVVYKSTAKKDCGGVVNPKWTEGFPPPLAHYDLSDSGWFKMKQFERWFKKVVLPWAQKSEDPKLVLGDNLSSHFSDEVMGLCREHQISFKCFPANTTHFLQPLDVAVFGPMKKQWRSILDRWRASNPRTTYNKGEFSRRLRELCDILNRQNILAGFRATGLVPFDVEEAIRHLPLVQQPPKDTWGSDLVNYLKKRTADITPSPTKRAEKRPEPGTDLQDPAIYQCIQEMVAIVVINEEAEPESKKEEQPKKMNLRKRKKEEQPKTTTPVKTPRTRRKTPARDSNGRFLRKNKK